jgi:hypothetical protein
MISDPRNSLRLIPFPLFLEMCIVDVPPMYNYNYDL